MTDFCNEALNSQSNIYVILFGGPPRTRIWNLPVRSRAPYPIWPAVLKLYTDHSKIFNVI